ncbi:hypothetical protein BJV74DRAFT_799607 [Russula compacta]|nr:hypothetical protein BJV74DRAFT_799607 [Russula compacta]
MKGRGGELQQKQTSSEAVQPGQGLLKKKKSHVQDIPNSILVNPMAPAPLKHPDAATRFGFHLPPSANVPQFLEQHPVVCPLAAIFPNSHAHPIASPLATAAVPLIAPVAETSGSNIQIDPSLLQHSLSQSSSHPPPFSSSSSVMHQRQQLAPPPPGHYPQSMPKGQVTGDNIRINNIPGLESNKDKDETDEDNKSKLGMNLTAIALMAMTNMSRFPLAHTLITDQDFHNFHDIHDNNQSSVQKNFGSNDFDNTRFQDVGTDERYNIYDPNDLLLAPDFDQSPDKMSDSLKNNFGYPAIRNEHHHTRVRYKMLKLTQWCESYDVLGRHYEQNRPPLPPDPKRLKKICSCDCNAPPDLDSNGQQSDEDPGSDQENSTDNNEGPKSRAKRHSQKPYTGLLIIQRISVSILLNDKAMQCVVDALSDHQNNGGKVEKGFWEDHQNDMCDYIFVDRSTFIRKTQNVLDALRVLVQDK